MVTDQFFSLCFSRWRNLNPETFLFNNFRKNYLPAAHNYDLNPFPDSKLHDASFLQFDSPFDSLL